MFHPTAVLGVLAAGAALSLGAAAHAQDGPLTPPVQPQPPEVADYPAPDGLRDEDGDRGRRYQPFNPFLDACEADRCLAVTISEEAAASDEFLGWMTDRAVEHVMAVATADYVDWMRSATGNNPFLVTAIYDNGTLVSSNATAMDHPWLGPDRAEGRWAVGPVSGPFLEDVLSSAARADGPEAAELQSPGVPDYAPGPARAGPRTQGARYPDGITALELDLAAFEDATPPERLGDAFVCCGPHEQLPASPAGESGLTAGQAPFIGGGSVALDGRIAVVGVVAATPRAVRGAQPVIEPPNLPVAADMQSFALVFALEPAGR
ncbi:hypothetical protein E5163_08955 [Marinicauda algicola]|uniref:Uncharacterized protein n=1 Tax=Marinicauda algicola TaxID=2029849 RepID=A0A4S2H110_9PROT|nr:hypothetical protein [Marinicauda algicola]TGY89237.1 hypothetical protein E5163_08955 [Marinicauda algicola]